MPESVVIERFKARLLARRLELSLTQDMVARRAGITTRRYQELESAGGTSTGRENPTLQTIIRLANALEVDVAYFFVVDPRISESTKTDRAD